MRLLGLSDGILELLERGELRWGHGLALLMTKDLEMRSQLARRAVQEGWSVHELERRVRESNESRPGPEEVGSDWEKAQERDAEQAKDHLVMNVARVWGDALGVEVGVRTLRGRKLRLEVVFDTPEGAERRHGGYGPPGRR